MPQKANHGETITGYELYDIRKRRNWEEILNSHIFPDLLCSVDISPLNDISDLRACCYQNGRINLYVPLKLSFSIEQMIAAIRSAYESDKPWLTEQLMHIENDPDAIDKIKKRLNGKIF